MNDFQNLSAIVGDYVRQYIDSDISNAPDILQDCRALIHALEKLESALVETIRAGGPGQYAGIDCVATVSVAVSRRLDVTRLKLEKPRLYESYLAPAQESLRVTVKRAVAL